MKQQWEEKQGQWGAPSKNCDRAPKEKSFSSSQQIANQLLRGTTHRTSACTFNERNSKQWNDAKKIKKGHNNRTKKTEIVEVMMKKKKSSSRTMTIIKRKKKSNTKPPDLREENHPKKQRREAWNSLTKKNDVKEQESQWKSMAAK